MKRLSRLASLMAFAGAFILSLGAVRAWSGCVTLAWDPSDGPVLAGYVVYYGLESRKYRWNETTDTSTTYEVCGLDEGIRYFFAVTAVDAQGRESDFSNEVSTVISPKATCDVNGDQHIDVTDVQIVVNVILGRETDPYLKGSSDVNGDGSITVNDLQMLVGCVLGN